MNNDSNESWALNQWLTALINRLRIARGITLDDDRVAGLLYELEQNGFYPRHVQDAETWILQGNWTTYKKTIALQDFYPTQEQIISVTKTQPSINYDRSDYWKRMLDDVKVTFYTHQAQEIIRLGLATRRDFDFVEIDRYGGETYRFIKKPPVFA